ncbi:hypothetical protein Pla52o_49130 [Novipirellula galeiformis]|uniref:Uncharacterized protein n=1 Tax=Novipirellula galeiformis TaxID=2528004 RepID=A0A5C6C0N0_9BACT|nr:hypothetical protein [Novipirellula galeiformis]TWU17698.1 hypothetical protein Pla52o_49130 [Novipirellula galeiformis]
MLMRNPDYPLDQPDYPFDQMDFNRPQHDVADEVNQTQSVPNELLGQILLCCLFAIAILLRSQFTT